MRGATVIIILIKLCVTGKFAQTSNNGITSHPKQQPLPYQANTAHLPKSAHVSLSSGNQIFESITCPHKKEKKSKWENKMVDAIFQMECCPRLWVLSIIVNIFKSLTTTRKAHIGKCFWYANQDASVIQDGWALEMGWGMSERNGVLMPQHTHLSEFFSLSLLLSLASASPTLVSNFPQYNLPYYCLMCCVDCIPLLDSTKGLKVCAHIQFSGRRCVLLLLQNASFLF